VNFLDLKTQVRKIIADRLAGDTIYTQDVYLGHVLNEASIPDLVGRHDWTWKEHVQTAPMAQGTYKLQMPSTLKDVRTLILMTGARGTTRPLVHKFPATFFESFADPSLQASTFPRIYTWVNREIWFDCPTAAAWSLRMVGLLRPNKLVNASDSPDFLDDDRHMLLVYHAAGFVFSVLEDSKNSLIWMKLYEAGVESWWSDHLKQSDREVVLGKFLGEQSIYGTEYWRDANVGRAPSGG